MQIRIEAQFAPEPLIGPRLRARGFAAQQTEAAIGAAVLNRMLAIGFGQHSRHRYRNEQLRCYRGP
jgi:hypothetical protein